MKRLGIIDIGSNSVRLILAEISNSGRFKIIDHMRESVRLGADMTEDNRLSKFRKERAVATLKTFKSYCDSVRVEEIIAVATEAVRKARDKDSFLDQIRSEVGIEVRVLSGEEEAYYDSLAVINSLYVKNSLVVDLGGSSMELARVSDNKIMECISLPFGAVNLTRNFQYEGAVSDIIEENIRGFILESYRRIPWLLQYNYDSIIGIGGTIRNLGNIHRKNMNYPLELRHNYEIPGGDIRKIYELVKHKSLEEKKKIEGLSEDRSDIFAAPAYAVTLLTELLSPEKLIICGKGLRDGLLYEYITRNYGPIGDVLDFSLECIISFENINKIHACSVQRLACTLFNKLKTLHKLDESVIKPLSTSALLHEKGLYSTIYNRKLQGFCLSPNQEINGLSHEELLISSCAAYCCLNRSINFEQFQVLSLLQENALAEAQKIGVLLIIAETIENNIKGKRVELNCQIEEEKVTLNVVSEKNIVLDKKEMSNISNCFSKVFGKDLSIISY